MIVGFTIGGWVTGGTAEEMATTAREDGRAMLAARICVDRFMAAPDAADRLAALKDEGTWTRNDTIEDAGWTTFAEMEEPVEGAADICAERLAEMELPSPEAAAATDTQEGGATGVN